MISSSRTSFSQEGTRSKAAPTFLQDSLLRWKALRVHRLCHKIYVQIDADAAPHYHPGLRLEHYYPWLFSKDLPVTEDQCRGLAAAAVLLSDSFHNRLALIRQETGCSVDPYSRKLQQGAFQLLDASAGERSGLHRFQQDFIKDQDEALAAEAHMLEPQVTFTDREYDRYARQKNSHLQLIICALGDLARQNDAAAGLCNAQIALSSALAMFDSYLQWRDDVQYPARNWFLNSLLRDDQRLRGNIGALQEVVYDAAVSAQWFDSVRGYCRACAQLAGQSGLRQLAEWLVESVDRLQTDLVDLRVHAGTP
jgi:hypothetical protein